MLEVKVRAKIKDTRDEEFKEYTPFSEFLDSLGIPSDNGKVYGYLTGDYIVGDVIEATDEYINHAYWGKVLPGTVQQYTNIDSHDGNPLYQGDIVAVEPMVPGDLDIIKGYHAGDTGVVTWLEGGWSVVFNNTAINLWQETLVFHKVGETDEA